MMMTQFPMITMSALTPHSSAPVIVTLSSIVTRVGMTVSTCVLTRVSSEPLVTVTHVATCVRWPDTDALSTMVTRVITTRVLRTLTDSVTGDHVCSGSEVHVSLVDAEVSDTSLESWC